VNYEVENMRVGDRTDFNRLKISIETNGTTSPREALERSIEIMIHQLKAVIGFQEEELEVPAVEEEAEEVSTDAPEDVNKTRIETLDLGGRVTNALTEASIRTVGGLAKKSAKELKALEGLGAKGVEEIEEALKGLGLELKEDK